MTEPTTPLVTIGLPVHNGQAYLVETLDAILAQTFTDFELIISDNASTDRTGDLCRSYAARDPRIRYVRNPINVGVARNFNRLVDLARGKYFKWAAADDLIEPDFLERCVAVLEADEGVVLAYARNMLIDAQGRVTRPYADGFALESERPAERFRAFFRAAAMNNPIFGLIRLETLRRTALVGAYRDADRVLLGHLALLGKFHEVPAFLFYRRVRGAAASPVRAAIDTAIAAWLDPASKRNPLILFPRWRWVVEYLRSVTRAPLSLGSRLRCYAYVVRFQVGSRYWWRAEWNTIRGLATRTLAGRESQQPI